MHRNLFTYKFNTKLNKPDSKIGIFDVINICIVISLCFLLKLKLFLPAGLSISLPNSYHIQRQPTQHIITIKSENLLILNESISSVKSLKSDINSQKIYNKIKDFNIPVLLRADRTVTIETIIKISDILHEAGYTKIHLALNKIN